MDKVKIAIVGCGRIGSRHATHISRSGELVAVCDAVEDRAAAMAKEHKANSYTSIDDMLAAEQSIDLVAVCSPNGLHAEHSITALKAGSHVLCEKPMAISAHDCGEMIKAAERANKRLFVVKQNRFNPPIAEVKRLLDEGVFGRVYSIQLSCFWNRNPDYYANSWKGTLDVDGGTLYTQFSHFVDLLYWLIGDIKEVHGFSGNFSHQDIIEFEDTGVIALKFHCGALGTINYTVNSFGKNMEGSISIFAEKGTVKVGGQYLNELEYQNIDGHTIEGLPESGAANNYGTYQGSMSNHDQVYENIVDVLQNGAEISTNAFEGLKTIEIIENIYSKIRTA